MNREKFLNEYGEGFESLEEFAESFQDGNELTDGVPMPEWGKIIEAIIRLPISSTCRNSG